MPGLGELNLFNWVAELDCFVASSPSLSGVGSDSVSLMALVGEPGLGGVLESDVLELREDIMKLCERCRVRFASVWSEVPSRGAGEYWSMYLLTFEWLVVLVKKLLTRFPNPGRSDAFWGVCFAAGIGSLG
jgi:hypothetical protein